MEASALFPAANTATIHFGDPVTLLQHSLPLERLITAFFERVRDGLVAIRDESSLKQALGEWLRAALPERCEVDVNQNISFFWPDSGYLLQKEVDLVIYDRQTMEKHAIELRFALEEGEGLEGAWKDVWFLEQLCEAGFAGCLLVMAAKDAQFYSEEGSLRAIRFLRQSLRSAIEGLRSGSPIDTVERNGAAVERRPAGCKEYAVHWQAAKNPLKYALIAVG